jgi:trimethylamine corrinoid protein
MAGKLVKLLSELQEQEAIEYVEKALEKGDDPNKILDETKDGMAIVGKKFAAGEYFIPDLIYSGEILRQLVQKLEPHLKKKGGEQKKLGKVIVGTVAGDIHDIGKDLVVFMLDVNGYEVTDLGIDVPIQKFVDAVKSTGATVVALSGFLTLAFENMKATIEALKAAGLRDKLKIMIGGGQIDEQVKKFTGADEWGKDAMDAVKLAKSWIK